MCVKTVFFDVCNKLSTGERLKAIAIFIILTLTMLNVVMLFTSKQYPIEMFKFLITVLEITIFLASIWLCLAIIHVTYYIIRFRNIHYVQEYLKHTPIQTTFDRFMGIKLDCTPLSLLERVTLLSRIFVAHCLPAILIIITTACIHNSYLAFPQSQHTALIETECGNVLVVNQNIIINTIIVHHTE